MARANRRDAQPKTLTYYRRWILTQYNAKPRDMSDAAFCRKYQLKVEHLRFWQQLAGQELSTKLRTMGAVEKTITPERYSHTRETYYRAKTFQEECANIIEITSGGRPSEKGSIRKRDAYCELTRYRLLQRIAALPSNWDSNSFMTWILRQL